MSIPTRKAIEYEMVKVDEWIEGKIDKIEEDMDHKFTFQGQEKVNPAVRFIFRLTGYDFNHYSRWMYFSYGDQTNLYLKYLVPLVVGASKDMNFDIQELVGMEVKTMWSEKQSKDGRIFQSLEMIRPLKAKLFPKCLENTPVPESTPAPSEPDDVKSEDEGGDVPF